ncbi:hypothetical protein PROVRETT_06307 [Providencia rettgeri DSM 1131]|nr:hypothetical protein PROVRETT_06307 [Providencia rettgeri DSM 1131]
MKIILFLIKWLSVYNPKKGKLVYSYNITAKIKYNKIVIIIKNIVIHVVN